GHGSGSFRDAPAQPQRRNLWSRRTGQAELGSDANCIVQKLADRVSTSEGQASREGQAVFWLCWIRRWLGALAGHRVEVEGGEGLLQPPGVVALAQVEVAEGGRVGEGAGPPAALLPRPELVGLRGPVQDEVVAVPLGRAGLVALEPDLDRGQPVG